ncbi:hypothetical protein BBJ29_009185 [Phytophthora kernoviae]|uniref:Uncharacterized protein n=1 Tax=Phytophthora kernoviae TaxID=325452 RepID=A0A421FTG1_9STRA|nr:hypothetical protein BBJ29_009185 [Phytophthora kernoviae]
MQHDPGEAEANGFHVDVGHAVQGLVASTLTQLTELWQTFGLSDEEQEHQHKVLVATVEKDCTARVKAWHDEIKQATSRVSELEKEIQAIKVQFQGNEGYALQVRSSRMAEISRLRDHLNRLDEKLGTMSTSSPDTDDVTDLSEEHKTMLRNLVQSKSREVRTRRAALLEAVSECVHLAQELQIEAERVFDADLDARLKVPENEQERFQKTTHGIGKATLASVTSCYLHILG